MPIPTAWSGVRRGNLGDSLELQSGETRAARRQRRATPTSALSAASPAASKRGSKRYRRSLRRHTQSCPSRHLARSLIDICGDGAWGVRSAIGCTGMPVARVWSACESLGCVVTEIDQNECTRGLLPDARDSPLSTLQATRTSERRALAPKLSCPLPHRIGRPPQLLSRGCSPCTCGNRRCPPATHDAVGRCPCSITPTATLECERSSTSPG